MRNTSKALLEVILVYALVIGICRILFSFRSVSFISQTLPLWAAGLFLYIPLSMLFFKRRKPEEWAITLDNLRFSLIVASLLSLLTLPSFIVLYQIYQKVWFHRGPMPLNVPSDLLLLLLYHLLCVALPEEVFYRGYMQSRLNEVFRKRVRVLSAPLGFGWLLTAVLFAVGHYLIDFRPDTLATFFPGLVFGWLRERTGSVLASTIFHALCNGTVLLLA